MNDIRARQDGIPAMSPQAIAAVTEIERHTLALPQVPIRTVHILHTGLYTRMITIPAGVVLTGALIKIATMLTISGDVEVFRGPGDVVRIRGTAVMPASAGRKQAFIAHADTTVVMCFPTQARTVEEAEAEFTDDTDMLMSHREPEFNTTIITGE